MPQVGETAISRLPIPDHSIDVVMGRLWCHVKTLKLSTVAVWCVSSFTCTGS